jgi:hypothetical protein
VITPEIIRTAAGLLDGTSDGDRNAKIYLQTELRSMSEAAALFEKIKAAKVNMGDATAPAAVSLAERLVEESTVVAPALLEPVAEVVTDVPETAEDAGITDDDIKVFARNLFKQNHSYAKTVEGVLAEFDGVTSNEAKDFTGQALEDVVWDEEQHADQMQEAAKKSRDKELEAQAEADKTFVDLYCVKHQKQKPVSPEEYARYAKLIRRAQEKAAPKFKKAEYPTFPQWVMQGTSIYEGFVKPVCDVNCRIDYFMWAPAAAMMLNFLGNKITVAMKGWKPSLFIVLIGEKGRAIKSASVGDAMKYFEYLGVLSYYSKGITNANGKTLVFQAGSTEGLGTDMQRTNCKNAVLLYDEFKVLAAKTSIQGSSMGGHLLTLYEGGNFSNNVKTKKDAFDVSPGTYCASLIACNTPKDFANLWSQFSTGSEGMEDRFCFFLQPETLPELNVAQFVNHVEAAQRTRQLIDNAVNQKTYEIPDQAPLQRIIKLYGNRAEIRAEKWALYFAIDLGRTTIDADCVARGIAMAEYEHAVKKYLAPRDAESKLAGWQQQAVTILANQPNGRMKKFGRRGFFATMDKMRFDTATWWRLYNGLIQDGAIKEDGDHVQLLRAPDYGEGDE